MTLLHFKLENHAIDSMVFGGDRGEKRVFSSLFFLGRKIKISIKVVVKQLTVLLSL